MRETPCCDWVFAAYRFALLPVPSHPLARWTRDGRRFGCSTVINLSSCIGALTVWQTIAPLKVPSSPELTVKMSCHDRCEQQGCRLLRRADCPIP